MPGVHWLVQEETPHQNGFAMSQAELRMEPGGRREVMLFPRWLCWLRQRHQAWALEERPERLDLSLEAYSRDVARWPNSPLSHQ